MLKSRLLRKRLDKIDWMSYVWLVYLPFSVDVVKGQWLWLVAIFIFFIFYVFFVQIPAWRRVTGTGEMLIAGLFVLFQANNYLIIYPGWQIPFRLAYRPKRYFYWFCGSYYCLLFSGLWLDFTANPDVFKWHNGDVLGLLFPIVAPICSYAWSRSLMRQRQLSQTNRRLQAIIRRDERDRIARDLHDSLGQSFSMITVKTELARKLLDNSPKQVEQELIDIEQTSRKNLQLVRSIVNDLHQRSISEVLLDQVQKLAIADIWLTTSGEAAATKWPTAVQNCFGAVIVEAITNVIRHAHANNVQLRFIEDEHTYRIIVQDDGRGKKYHRSGSNGIEGMRSRLLALNGSFDIDRNATGTRVVMSIPKE